MSYYEDRIKALEAKVEEMAFRERMKAIPVEAKLMDRIAELKAEVERLTDKIRVSDNHAQCLEFVINSGTANELRLQAQVERLTKAGDAMASSIQFNEEMAKDYNGPTIVHQSVQRWNAAKEGKQS